MLSTILRVLKKIFIAVAVWFMTLFVVLFIGSSSGLATAGEAGSAVYSLSAVFIPIIVAILFILPKRNKASTKKNPDSVINYVRGNDDEVLIEPIINHNSQTVHTPATDELANPSTSIETELFRIDCMEGHDFEYWCAQLLTDCGFSKVVVTQGSGDQGVDIIAEKDGIRYAIQCKCYSKDLGNSPVQEVTAGKSMPQYHCQIGAVMTNRHFTKGAKDLADATGTLLWDRDWIENKLATVRKLSRTGYKPSITYSDLAPDVLFSLAVEVILDTDQASVSMLQRRLKLDYEHAARLMDRLEEKRVVGPYREGRLREILITKAQWETMK